jgi:DNA-binding MarR family transcriptional regulator
MHSESGPDLGHVFEQLVRVVRGLSTAGDLTLPAATTLSRSATEGPQRLTDLASRERRSQPGMTQLVTRLERDGLVRRTHSPDDGRVVLVEITQTGRDLLEQRRTQRTGALSALLDRLDPTDRDAVRATLPALQRLTELALVDPIDDGHRLLDDPRG